MMSASGLAESKGFSMEIFGPGVDKSIGCYHAAIQELIVIDDLLSVLVGIEGRYISIRGVQGKDDSAIFQVDASMDLVLQESAKRIFPLCESYIYINQFVESRSEFKSGLVNHAFAAALRTLLLVGSSHPFPFCFFKLDYQAMVAQLEHQFRLGKLSIQGLWFYCQPMMGSMLALSILIKKASASNSIGSVVLNLLQSQAKAMAGDHVVRSLLEKMSQSANQAYLGILERWVYEGVIDDPYGEFFIAENQSLQKESLTHDYDAKYWQQRYSLKDDIPSFLANAAETILITGKYLNVMRECGHSIQVPVAENLKLTTVGSNHRYLECIKAAYDFASGELLNLVKEKVWFSNAVLFSVSFGCCPPLLKLQIVDNSLLFYWQYDLMGKLRSIKHYLLLDQGDFLVHFMDIAREELMKKPDEISAEKLQSLLDLALRSTAAVADPCHEDLTCCVERTTLLKRLSTLKDLQMKQSVSSSNDLEEPVSITGLETFSLSFKVLEPNWHVMHNRLQTAKSIDEVIQYHDFFLEKCLRECLLLSPVLLKKLEKMKSICLQYASAAQWLVTYSNDSPKTESPDVDRYKKLKLRSRSQLLNAAPENAAVVESILKFEKEFSRELQSLGPILSSSSYAEPYLTHLAQWLLGVGRD
ncbi:gamma-tubulin complex component [Striga asiatica]|uniref:Gamma-tubulin complex component n=1 Tax=Striga asiatica TaxID=4170 RepID=A0A5A7P6K1_STRAF|nr:gamma-tubulin complex component [Striga asiatica]